MLVVVTLSCKTFNLSGHLAVVGWVFPGDTGAVISQGVVFVKYLLCTYLLRIGLHIFFAFFYKGAGRLSKMGKIDVLFFTFRRVVSDWNFFLFSYLYR